jgi:hypothetical protein
MAIGVTMRLPGASTAQYDEVCRLMGLRPHGAGPAGLLFHWAAADGDGMLITDVWQERERFEQFAREQIGPYSRQAGIDAPTDTTVYDVHNYNYRPADTISVPRAPIAVVLDYGGTLAQYDEVVETMGFEHGSVGPEGGLFHWAAETESGVRITDAWQDRQILEDFIEHQIKPHRAKAGVDAPRSLTYYAIHNYFTAG